MKAISLPQPTASLITLGAARIVVWASQVDYRGPLAIRASATVFGSPMRRGEYRSFGDFSLERDDPRGGQPQYLLRGSSLAHPYRLPFGAIIGEAELVDCLAVTSPGSDVGPPCLELRACLELREGRLTEWAPLSYREGKVDERDRSDQLAYSRFRPGWWALVLSAHKASPPVPAERGGPGLWDWEPTANQP